MHASYLTKRMPAAAWPLGVGAVVTLAHVPEFVHRLLDGDEAIYGSIAVLMNMGGDLYGAGGVDNKPPGIFWVYALTFRVFGGYQMTAIHAAGFVAMAATCVVIFVIARDIAGRNAGLLAALFYGVLTAAGNPRLLATNTEILMMLPLAASVLFMLRRRWLWAAAMLAGAGAFRQSAAVNVLLLAAGVLWLEPAERRLWAVLLSACGAAAAALGRGRGDRRDRDPDHRLVGIRPHRRPADLRLRASGAAARGGGRLHRRPHHARGPCLRLGRLARALRRVRPCHGVPLSWVPAGFRRGIGRAARGLGRLAGGVAPAPVGPGLQPAGPDHRHGGRGLERLLHVPDERLPGGRPVRGRRLPPGCEGRRGGDLRPERPLEALLDLRKRRDGRRRHRDREPDHRHLHRRNLARAGGGG